LLPAVLSLCLLAPCFVLTCRPAVAQEGEDYTEEEMLGYNSEEMYSEEMYSEEEMLGYGSGSRRRGGSVGDVLTNQVSTVLTSIFPPGELSGVFSPDAAPPVQSGPVLANEALVAYSVGDFPLAMELYFGHIIAEYDQASEALNRANFSRLMKRPVWQLRWGVSYAVRGDATDPQPIQESDTRQPGGAGSYSGEEMAMGMGMEEEMMMSGMEEMGMGEEMYSEEGMTIQSGGPGAMPGGMYGRRQPEPVAPATPAERLAEEERPMLSEQAETELEENLGVVATVLGEEMEARYTEGSFGRAMTDVTAESGNKETVTGAFVDAVQASSSLPLWKPAIQYLGQGDSDVHAKTARAANIDLLLHFDVLLKPGRGDFVQNISRCRLIHVPTGKSLGVSKAIDSLEHMQKSRLRGQSGREYVSEQLSNLLGIIDREAKSMAMPALTEAVAKRRIGSLLASGGGKNLRTLAEVRLYQSMQLLSEEDVLTAFDIVGGDEALQMVYGPEAERLALVRQWALNSQPEASQPEAPQPPPTE